jgi:hypothetical protein
MGADVKSNGNDTVLADATRTAALVDAVREWSRSVDARGGAHDRLQDAWDAFTLAPVLSGDDPTYKEWTP